MSGVTTFGKTIPGMSRRQVQLQRIVQTERSKHGILVRQARMEISASRSYSERVRCLRKSYNNRLLVGPGGKVQKEQPVSPGCKGLLPLVGSYNITTQVQEPICETLKGFGITLC